MDADDNASVASTVENEVDPDIEWPVKQILAEGQVGGRTMYLIEWEDYPLSDATWEPTEHFEDSLLEDWAHTKQKQHEGKIPRFHLDEWRMAKIQHVRDKYARHEMRNRERQRRGLNIEHFDKTLEELIAEINATPSDQPRATGDSAHQPTTTDAAQPTSQEAVLSEDRSRRSSIDDLFSDPGSEMEVDTSLGYCDPVNEEEVITPKLKTDPVSVQAAAPIQDTSLRPERTQQLLAGIAIEPAVKTLSKNIMASQEPAMLLMKHMPDTQSDLDSDAMDIDDASGNTSPATPSHTRIYNESTKLTNNDSIDENLPVANVLQRSPKASRAAGKPSRESARHEEKNNNDFTSTSSARPTKSGKRVSFSLTAPIKERHSSKAEASLFVPDRSHKQGFSASSPKQGFSTQSVAKSVKDDCARERNSVGDSVGDSLMRTCVIGSIKLTCSFHVSSRPADSQTGFYERLMELEVFHFSHICTAQDFLRQLRATELSSGFWVEGTACSQLQANGDNLRAVLDCLHSSSFGLLCHSDGFCLVIYPSKSADWQQSPLPTSPPPASHLLRYLAFAPASTFQVSDLLLDFDIQSSSGISIFDKQLYHKLLPSNDLIDKSQPITDSFFLIFPPSGKPEEDLLCRWLRVFNRNCEIHSCAISGHWAKFIEGSRGAVILHQDCIQSLHRLPHFSKLLHSRNEDYNFWIFRLRFFSPVFEPQLMDEYMERVGIALDWAFPPGIAVMAPPSFFISQPMQAYNMLKWIWQNFSAEATVYRHGKLIVCHDMDDWLLSLALEKSEASLDVRESKHFLEVRMKTFMLMRKLLEQDITSPVVCAPVYIDGNDEQSLVNWFGWWSVSQVGKFRKYSVICSDNDDDKRLSRYIKRSSLRELFSKASSLNGATAHAERVSFKLVQSDAPLCLSAFIRGVSSDAREIPWNPLVICPWPVIQHEGKSQYGDASQWVNFFAEQYVGRAISGTGFPGRKNTHLGFFYTADDAQKRADVHIGQCAHPWMAFVRPMELHRKPWKQSELLIWDYRLRNVARQSQIMSESDLSPAQRDLITEVTTQYAKMNLPLGKVWAGGFKASKSYPHTLDITLDWMKAVVTNVKNWLPLNHDDMMNRGWSLVRNRSSPSRSHSPTAGPSGCAEMGEYEAPEEAQRILFNPPNAGSRNPKPYTNRLYQWAMAARVPKESVYTYVPTLEWYRDQQGSGRGFEHVRVWSWKAFFEHYKIVDPEK